MAQGQPAVPQSAQPSQPSQAAPAAANAGVQLSIANYNAGSYIIIENKKDHDYFFIVRTGRVRIDASVNALLGTGSQIIGPGDFFGVIGSMTGHPRMQTAIAVDNCSLIAVKKAQFGVLIQKNAPLALKIIRSFSKQLRMFDSELAKRTTKGDHDEENPENLYHNAEFYFKMGNVNLSAYMFDAYLTLRPNGMYRTEATERLKSMSNIDIASLKKDKSQFNRVYQDGEILAAEYEHGDELYIIQEGRIKITKIINNQEILLAVLNAGDIVGEMALLDDKSRAASIIAYGTTRVMAVNKANFDKIVIQNAQMATKLVTILSDRVWTIYKQLANLLFAEPLARLWDTLLTQLLKQHVVIGKKIPHQFSFGPKELLKLVGIEGPDGEIAINKLLQHRCISVAQDKIFCSDTEEIKKEVDFALKMQERGAKVAANKSIGRSRASFM